MVVASALIFMLIICMQCFCDNVHHPVCILSKTNPQYLGSKIKYGPKANGEKHHEDHVGIAESFPQDMMSLCVHSLHPSVELMMPFYLVSHLSP